MSPWTSLKHFMQNEYLSEKSAGVGFLKRNSARDQRSTGTRYEDCCCFSELMGDRVGASYSNGRIKGGSLPIKISRIEFDLKAK